MPISTMNVSLLSTAAAALIAIPASGVTVVYDQFDALFAPVAAGTAPILTTSSEAFMGSGSWQANGVAKSTMPLGVTASLGSFTVGQIANITWHTQTGVVDNADWYLTIYTAADGSNDDASWYGRRLTIENLYANNRVEQMNTWNEWTTDAGANQVTFHDGNRTNQGFYNGPTLADITAGPLDWGTFANSGSTDVIDYASEVVADIVFETGSGWAAGFNGLIDGITIELVDGSIVTYDLEVPAPGAFALLGLAGLAARRRHRRA